MYEKQWVFQIIFQMYVPNSVKVYGSNIEEIEILAVGYKYYFKRIIMRKTHLKSLNQQSEPCSNDKIDPDTSLCIAKYIERMLGCNPMILGSSPKQLTCNSSSQWENAATMTKKFHEANAKQIYEMTGCLSSCEKDKYHKIEGDLTTKNRKNGDLHLSFRIMDGSYEEREQYIIYDLDSFIADVGGFMGLLLGCSVLSLYRELDALLGRRRCGPLKKSDK